MSTRAERNRRKEREQQTLSIANTPEQKRITCYHESTHGVLNSLFDFQMEYISVVPEVERNHPLMGKRVNGGIVMPVRMGGCQLQRKDGIFSLESPERVFFCGVALMASFITETKIGVPREAVMISCASDASQVLNHFHKHLRPGIQPKTLHEIFSRMEVIGGYSVYEPTIWAAIEKLAGVLMERGRVEGSVADQITREVIPDDFFLSRETQGWMMESDYVGL